MKLGVDTGGTFTDFILQVGADFRRYKCPSTPDDPSEAILTGLNHFFPDGPPRELEIIHGTTVGTNAFLERKGGTTLLLTSKGFEDVLAIGRQNRASLFDLNVKRAMPVISRDLIVGLRERLDAEGEVVVPLASADVVQLKSLVESHSIDVIVICFLHSFLNDVHERKAQLLLVDLGIPVLCSVDILPEFREFERCSTALINGYLAPVMSAYINKLATCLEGRLLSIQQSNGGVMGADMVSDRAIHTLLSGPAAGVQGAYQLASQSGNTQFITFDMGGTSTDVCLCDRRLALTKEYILDQYPISIPVLDIHTVGAGGGSIAYIDQASVLQVGPMSAGADPGPVCYGKGTQLTVTDANVLLGRLLPEAFLAGRMSLNSPRALRYAEQLASELDLSVTQLCLGVIAIVNAGMVKAVRKVSLDRGYDPADFSLYSFGGASGLHCCELAEELGINSIVIPARAGVLSAQGLVFATPLLDRTKALFLQGGQCTYDKVKEHALRLESEVRAQLLAMVKGDGVDCESFIDLRYVGQAYEISIPVSVSMNEAFHTKHKQLFGYNFTGKSIESVSLRSVARKATGVDVMPVHLVKEPSGQKQEVAVVLAQDKEHISVYQRECLPIAKGIKGPCLIVDDYTTILVTAAFSCVVDGQGTLVLQKENNL